jgi:phospholipase/carboxylesterase
MSAENNLLPRIELNPSQPAVGAVIVLHGLGADGNDFVPIVSELQLPPDVPLRFVFPNAPLMRVTINNGYEMPAWYDILSANIIQRADLAGLDQSIAKIQSLIAHEVEQGIPEDKIVLAGFSQGAVVALTAGLRAAKPLAGILALSGYLPYPEQVISQSSPTARNVPIFMAHGTQDMVVPYPLGQNAFDNLKKAGFAVNWQNYAMGHSVCETEIKDISKWLTTLYT